MYIAPNSVADMARRICAQRFREACSGWLNGCSVIPSTDLTSVDIYADWFHAENCLIPNRRILLQEAARCHFEAITIRWQYQKRHIVRRYPVSALPPDQRPDPDPNLPPILGLRSRPKLAPPIVKSKADIDYNQLHHGANCVYINQIADQTNLWANQTALRTQGKKPAEFLVVQNAFALNYPNELDARMSYLLQDGQIREYSYEAMRWFQEDDGVWRRRHMEFVSNFWRIDYLGQDCWLGEVLHAQPKETFEAGELAGR